MESTKWTTMATSVRLRVEERDWRWLILLAAMLSGNHVSRVIDYLNLG